MSNDPIVSPAYDKITESQVLEALDAATIRQFARALDPGAFRGDHGADGFRCPDCRGWSATVLDDWRWTCTWCATDLSTTTAGQRTRLALRARVADSYEACLRLVLKVVDPRTLPTPSSARARGTTPSHGGKVLT